MTPSCTILIPTKDRPGLLGRALASALTGAPRDAEILVVDDHSSPPAQKIIARLDDPRLRVVVNDGAAGAAGARNFGVLQARGPIVFFLDDDDELLAGYCDHILTEVLPAAPDLDYGFSAYRVTDSPGADAGLDRIGGARLPDGPVAPDAPFRRRLCGFGVGFWIRREVFDALGPIAEDLPTNEDTEYSCRLIEAGKSAWFCARPGVRLHRHAPAEGQRDLDHLTARTGNAARAACFLAIYNRHPSLVQSDTEARRHLTQRYLKLAGKGGRLAPGWQFAATLPRFRDRMSARAQALLFLAAGRLKAPKRGPES